MFPEPGKVSEMLVQRLVEEKVKRILRLVLQPMPYLGGPKVRHVVESRLVDESCRSYVSYVNIFTLEVLIFTLEVCIYILILYLKPQGMQQFVRLLAAAFERTRDLVSCSLSIFFFLNINEGIRFVALWSPILFFHFCFKLQLEVGCFFKIRRKHRQVTSIIPFFHSFHYSC